MAIDDFAGRRRWLESYIDGSVQTSIVRLLSGDAAPSPLSRLLSAMLSASGGQRQRGGRLHCGLPLKGSDAR